MSEDNPTFSDETSLLSYLDLELGAICAMVGRLCAEAHMSDADIDDILEQGDRNYLEIITDTADEVLAKIEMVITEARLAIQTLLAKNKLSHPKSEVSNR